MTTTQNIGEENKNVDLIKIALASIRINTSKKADEDEIQIDNCLPIISLKEVSDHEDPSDCWIIIYDRVYNITKFLSKVSYGYKKGDYFC